MLKSELLFELGCEELPPKILKKMASELAENLYGLLNEHDLTCEEYSYFATPRRLAVKVKGLVTAQADKNIERQGPAVAAAFDDNGEPKPAAIGFAKSCGVDVKDLQQIDTPKGKRLAFKTLAKGKHTKELLPMLMYKAIDSLTLPKTMRWGNSDAEFIRPPQWCLFVFNNEIVECNVLGCSTSDITYGHRFHSPSAIKVEDVSQYESLLNDGKVIADFDKRKAVIRDQVDTSAKEVGGTAVIDEDLLDEVTALVEWPIALSGSFNSEFLQVPPEALIATMKSDQKFFHLVDKDNKLLPNFITVANIDSKRKESVIEGNERVIRPRLADAKFFFDQDKKLNLESHFERLKKVVFQKELGSLFEKSSRVSSLAEGVAETIGAELEDTKKAAMLSKCDLMTNMVYEFPELQGYMGMHYARLGGEKESICQALNEVYMPRFSGDELPKTGVGIALSIAERIDTLVGIFGINQGPSGTKDPFALRRAALGLIRIIVEKELYIDLRNLIDSSLATYTDKQFDSNIGDVVLEFIRTRAERWFIDMGHTSQCVRAVFTTGVNDLFDATKRLDAVSEFNNLEESVSLAAANKRVSNILSKVGDSEVDSSIHRKLLSAEAEISLVELLTKLKPEVDKLLTKKEYKTALAKLSTLKVSVDHFFDEVMVNDENLAVRSNRLAILNTLRQLFLSIADIALLQK